MTAVRNQIFALWRRAGRSPRAYLVLALLFEAMVGLAICHGRHLETTLIQFDLGARELVNTGHIQSTFLPVGYAALLGWAESVGAHLPYVGPNTAVLDLQVGIMVLLVGLARTVLRRFGSARFATTMALLVGLDPQLMTFVKSMTDTNLTVVVLFALTAALLLLRERANVASASVTGLALAAAVHVRPNLALMVALLPWALWGQAARVAFGQAAVALGTALLAYGLFATAVHGRPFYPHNGPYNLYAGYNAYTADALAHSQNGEDSIAPAMREHGFSVTLDWTQQPDKTNRPDPRDERYIPFYERESRAYIQAHPGAVLKLFGQKLRTFFHESYANFEHRSALFYLVTIMVKLACLLIIPAWGLLVLLVAVRRTPHISGLFVGMALLYLIPFVTTNSDPRFRIPLEAVLLLDVIRMLYLRWRVGWSASETVRI